MFKTLLRLLAVVGTLYIVTAQFVFEYDYNIQNPEPRLNANPDDYTRYRNLHFTRKQCPEIEFLVGTNIEKCSKKCNANFKCTALNLINGAGHNGDGITCSLKACGNKPPYPIGVAGRKDKGQFWDGYSKTKIEKGYTRYYGPHKGYYTEKQGCRYPWQIGEHRSYVECMDFCDRDTKCTGININLGNFDCQLFQCGDRTTPPLGDDLTNLESWSKHEIKANVPNSYIGYKDYHYSSRQCSNLHASKGQGFGYCKSQCDAIERCTAFNFKDEFIKNEFHYKNKFTYKDEDAGICVLRDCGPNPPYPIGKATGWSGFSLNKIEYGYAKYFGPYGRHWSTTTKCSNIINGQKTEDTQKVDCLESCRQQGPTRKAKTSVLCEQICDETEACSGFNFNIKSYDCELVACTSRTTIPTEEYTEWEGWSKEKITDRRGLGPNPKCPSFSCTINAVVDIAKDKRCTLPGWFGTRHSACMCRADPWCFYRCSECNYLDHKYLNKI